MTHRQISSLIIIAAAPLAGRTSSADQPFVKLEILGGRPVVSRVFLNGQGPFRFLLDTGAQSNQVETSLARKLGLTASFQVALDTRLGTTRAEGGRVAGVTLGKATAADQEFLFTTMEAVHALSPDIQGVLGQEFLSHFDYLLDFRGRRLVLGATVPDGTRVPARVIDGRLAIQTNFGDLVLDSGTQALVLFHTPASLAAGGTIRTASGPGAVSVVQDATVRIGSKSYRAAMAAVAANPPAPEDGLLPASLFGSIFVSNSARYVIAEPRPQRWERISQSFQAGIGRAKARPDTSYRFSTAKYSVGMRVSFPPPYEGKRLVVHRNTQPGQENCLSAELGISGCAENFVGAVAVVAFDVHRVADGKPAAASIREVVTVVEQSPGLPDRPPFAMSIKLVDGIGSDLQAFGYDESPAPRAERPAERERAKAEWRHYRQELYIDKDRRPFAVVEWLHRTTGIRILRVDSAARGTE